MTVEIAGNELRLLFAFNFSCAFVKLVVSNYCKKELSVVLYRFHQGYRRSSHDREKGS
jgi:hypothetical protein